MAACVDLSVALAAAGCVEDAFLIAPWVPENRSPIDSACCVLAGGNPSSCPRTCCQAGYPEG